MAVDIGILVVDDEPALCKTIAAILCNAGYRATPCGDPDLALTLLQDWSFALLITDHSMPGMSGLKLIERARLSSPSLKFIVLSGSL
ncbi:MAG TPA: response regulator, partial [Verrucomicrobiae bacterium]